MSRTLKRISKGEPQKDHESVFVLDFLYHDSRRIQSFLAQFQEVGHLQQSRSMRATGRSSTNKYAASLSSEIPIIAKGQANLDKTNVTEGKTSLEETYDPFWSNARLFLDFAESANLFMPVLDARIGNLIKFTGNFIIVDMPMLQRMCQVKELRELFRKVDVKKAIDNDKDILKLRGAARSRAEAAIEARMVEGFNQNAEVLALLPNGVHCHIMGDKFSLWTIFDDAHLVPAAGNIMLKHGVMLGHNWTVVGILDAMPGRLELTEENLAALFLIIGQVGAMAIKISQYTRNLFGKPESSGAITPLLVYREVHPAGGSQ